MRKHLSAALCCSLLFASEALHASEIGLLDRLAQEKIIEGDASAVQSPPSPEQADRSNTASPRTAVPQGARSRGRTSDQELNTAQANDLRRQLDETVQHKQALTVELADLEKQMAELIEVNEQLANRQFTAPEAQAGNGSAQPSGHIKVNASASVDTRISYAIGTWYAESAPQESQKLASIGKKLDLAAFAQGFSDKINNRMQLGQDKITAELAAVDRQLDEAMLSKNEKHSRTILAAAAKEKGAVTMPDGAIYKVLDKGKAPALTDDSDILFEFDEALATGETLASRESRSSHVKDLPQPFRTIVKQLGRGGSVKIHIPVSAPPAPDSGISMGASPSTVSIITIKIVGIK